MLAKSGGALHETPDQLEIIRPLTRFARRVGSPEALIDTIAEAVAVLRGSLPGPAFIEIPHDFFLASVSADLSMPAAKKPGLHQAMPVEEIEDARRQIAASRSPAILVGAGVCDGAPAVRQFAELLKCPVFTTTSGKGTFAGDHPLSLGCISVWARCRRSFNKAICSFPLARASLSSIPAASDCSFRNSTFRLSKTLGTPEIGFRQCGS